MEERFQRLCKEIRLKLAYLSNKTGSSHIGSALSSVEIVAYLLTEKMNFSKELAMSEERDIFILSKGHASSVLYVALNKIGTIDDQMIESFYQNGSNLIGHVNHKVPGVEFSTGSLGHGLSVAAGYALGFKISKKKNNVYCLLGDGECDEGSVWEALRFISLHNLDNLSIIIDSNRLQGIVTEVGKPAILKKMLMSIGLDFQEIDGHNHTQLKEAFNNKNGKVKIVFANTTKGKGISFMENKLEWHYKSLDDEQYRQAEEELR
jgi:transketolase